MSDDHRDELIASLTAIEAGLVAVATHVQRVKELEAQMRRAAFSEHGRGHASQRVVDVLSVDHLHGTVAARLRGLGLGAVLQPGQGQSTASAGWVDEWTERVRRVIP